MVTVFMALSVKNIESLIWAACCMEFLSEIMEHDTEYLDTTDRFSIHQATSRVVTLVAVMMTLSEVIPVYYIIRDIDMQTA